MQSLLYESSADRGIGEAGVLCALLKDQIHEVVEIVELSYLWLASAAAAAAAAAVFEVTLAEVARESVVHLETRILRADRYWPSSGHHGFAQQTGLLVDGVLQSSDAFQRQT